MMNAPKHVGRHTRKYSKKLKRNAHHQRKKIGHRENGGD
jgi:hypothetical protein